MTKWYKSAGFNTLPDGSKKECWRVRPYNKALSILETEGYAHEQLLIATLRDGNLPEMTLALFACKIYQLVDTLRGEELSLQPSIVVKYRHSLCQDALNHVRVNAPFGTDWAERSELLKQSFKGIYLYIKSTLEKISNDTWWLSYEHPEEIKKGMFLYCKPLDEDYFERVL